jgi:ribosomal protein S18 acetylase RimI-like enzyme
VTVDADDLRLMQGLAQTVYMLRPEFLNNDATYGELAWTWGMDRAAAASSWRHRRWLEAGEVVGWGWIQLPRPVRLSDGTIRDSTRAYLAWLVHPRRPELVDEILDWYDEQARGLVRTVGVRAANTDAVARLCAHGFTVDELAAGDEGFWVQLNARDLDGVYEPALPRGYRFRTAEDVDTEAVWRAHVGAWHPSTLTLEGMRDVQASASYRPDLHVLIQSPDGMLVSSATIWLDAATGAAEFEPVGTHPQHRRRGLGRALLLHGMTAAKLAGASRMLVACLGAPARPAARALYYDIGFHPIARDLPHIKQPDPRA